MFSDIRNINEILSEEGEFKKLKKAIDSYEVIEKFFEIFPDLTKVTNPVKIEKNILHLRVENSVWRSELNFRKSLLIKKINLFFGKDIVKGIKFI